MVHSFFLSLILLVLVNSARAQSTVQSKPTPLTTSEYTAKGPTKETNYYFSFTGGPGEVSVTLKIKATDYSTFARIEILTSGMATLATHNMNATTGTGPVQVVKTVSLKKQQTLIIKLTLDANLEEYGISLAGKVDVATTTEDAGSTEPEANNASSQQPQAEAPTADTTPSPTATNTASKIFNIDFSKYKIGQLIKLPKTGTLEIQMADGTTQTIDLKTIKSIAINKHQ